jgi:16S rRNA (uracil1498-N3)-methyltransferase
MKRLVLPGTYSGESSFTLSGPEFHHLIRVSRFKKGDCIKVSDAHGVRYEATICEITDSEAILNLEKEKVTLPDLYQLCLVQSISKGKKMDIIIRQATEAGITGIYPVFSKYSVVKLQSEKDIDKKYLRWIKIAKEAVQQSGSRKIVHIERPKPIADLGFEDEALILFFHQEIVGSIPLHTALSNDYKIIYILIGPEGGFSEDEVRAFLKKRFIPVYLGENVLRVETAAIYAIASVQTVLLEKEIWRNL